MELLLAMTNILLCALVWILLFKKAVINVNVQPKTSLTKERRILDEMDLFDRYKNKFHSTCSQHKWVYRSSSTLLEFCPIRHKDNFDMECWQISSGDNNISWDDYKQAIETIEKESK